METFLKVVIILGFLLGLLVYGYVVRFLMQLLSETLEKRNRDGE